MLYLLLTSLPLLFGREQSQPGLFNYDFNSIGTGLSYLGLAIGFFFGCLVQIYSQTKIWNFLTKRNGEGRPEYRLLPMTVRTSFGGRVTGPDEISGWDDVFPYLITLVWMVCSETGSLDCSRDCHWNLWIRDVHYICKSLMLNTHSPVTNDLFSNQYKCASLRSICSSEND